MPKTKIKKKSLYDKFYTKDDIAKSCIRDVLDFNINFDYFIEPSAGNGSFYKYLPTNKIGMDIEPEHPYIIKEDFLSSNYITKNSCIIGNPPFGVRNNLAKKFIKHSLEAKMIAFILPQTYNKITCQCIFPYNFSLAFQKSLGYNSFTLNGNEYHVPSIFQIWIRDFKGDDLRQKLKWNGKCTDFEFSKNGGYFVFGAAPNKILKAKDVQKNNRGYYFNCIQDESYVLNNFTSIYWKKYGNSSVNGGVFWMTKEEIISSYMKEVYDDDE